MSILDDVGETTGWWKPSDRPGHYRNGRGRPDPVPWSTISVDDFQAFINSSVGGKEVGSMGDISGFQAVSEGAAHTDSSGNLIYDQRAMQSGYGKDILGYLAARNQGKQAQADYIQLLKERPGRRGTILTTGESPQIAQTIRSISAARRCVSGLVWHCSWI
jgi:hypothetical protein